MFYEVVWRLRWYANWCNLFHSHHQRISEISSDNLCSSKQPDTMPHYGIHDELMDDWEKELQGTGDIVLSDEVDSYLIDRLEANDKTARRFDILGWWKIKGMNSYPTLAIQVSTVAS
ncbi:hypothetical protein ACHQM5_000823 [Ranunculus cassubicifolius]